MRRSVSALLLLAALSYLVGLGVPAISDSDEAFYAEASREMVGSGDWLTPHFNYEYRWQKPVLYYWLTAATYNVFGITEWGARLWSALSGLGLVLLTWGAGRRLSGRDDVAWVAGATVATSFGYFAIARLALPDLPLTFFITAGIWAALERRWAWAGAAAGLGFLTKGPVALVVPALVLVPVWWRERRTLTLPLGGLVRGALLFAAVGLPWYAAMTLEHGPAYLESFFIGDNLERFATDRFNEPRPLWFYVPIVLGGLMPWSAYFLLWIQPARDLFSRRWQLTAVDWRLALWAGMPLLFYTASIGKQPRYILPVLPPLAIILARAIAAATDPARTAPSPALRAAGTSTAVILAVVAALLYRARTLLIAAPSWATASAIVLLAVAAAVVLGCTWSRRWRALPGVTAVAACVTLLAVQFGALSGVRPEPVEEMASLVRQYRKANEPVGEYQVFVRNLVFYTGFKQQELPTEGAALDFLRSPQRVLLVVRAGDLERLEAISGVKMQPLGEIWYLNTANLKMRTLIWPLPEEDIQRVLLVTNR